MPSCSVPAVRRLVLAAALLGGAGLAQCPNPSTWLPGEPLPACDGYVAAMVRWDPDGPGPLGEHVVCGGAFGRAGGVAASNIALYEPVGRTWSALGAGVDGPVLALLVTPGGALIASGNFASSGASPIASIAQWNGAAWVGLGSGVQGSVNALAQAPNGDLFAGGAFASAGGVAASNIARWDGVAWSALGGGITGLPSAPVPPPPFPSVYSLGMRSTGELIVAGMFGFAGGIAAPSLARWSGGAWSVVPSAGALTFGVTARVLANDDVVAWSRDPLTGSPLVARWNGVSWTPMVAGLSSPPGPLVQLANGALVAATGAGFATDVKQWTGTSWVPWPAQAGTAVLSLLELANGDLLAGGYDDADMRSLRRWNGVAWLAPAPGCDGLIYALLPLPDGRMVVGGMFEQIGNAAARGVALRQNGAWSALGGGIDGHAFALALLPNGDVVVGGDFTQAGSVPAGGIARWDGALWHAYPPLAPGVATLLPLANGDLLVGGWFAGTVARGSGGSWQILNPPTFSPTHALAELPNGDLVIGASYGWQQLLYRWNGSAWSAFGPFVGTDYNDNVAALQVLPNGDLVVAGQFSVPVSNGTAQNVARWDGAAWVTMGAGLPVFVGGLALLPNGDLVAAHNDRDVFGAPVLAPSRWNGSAWTPIVGLDGPASRAAATVDGELWFSGVIVAANGMASGGFARLYTGCPAGDAPIGAGCSGSAGPLVTTVESRPWLGGTFRARTTGMPSSSLAVRVLGLSAVALPLASVLPQGLPGCTLHVSPDLLTVLLPASGAATGAVPIPVSAGLLGQSFLHQVVSLELAASGAIAALASGDASLLTIGAW